MTFLHRFIFCFLFGIALTMPYEALYAQEITSVNKPAQLDIRSAEANSVRITLKPLSYEDDFPFTPALAEKKYSAPVISLRRLDKTVTKKIGNLTVEVRPGPLTVIVTNSRGQNIQHIIFENEGNISFKLDTQPILGMGEGGPKPQRGVSWRSLPIQFDRSAAIDSMQPRWQSDAYGSRNPVAMLIGTEGWGLFVATPWVMVDLRQKDRGLFIPWKPTTKDSLPQTQRNQQLNNGKGIHPINKIVPGLYDFFVFDAHEPLQFIKEFSLITGPAVLPPKWALGYMQSHRTLEDDNQMIDIIDGFRSRKIPLDAVIYLGTGFTPKGWNKMQPSFEFNPEVFKRDPQEVIADIHARNAKVILHIVPWDRDKLSTLQGSIPARPGEILDSSHISNYWKQHLPLIKAGVDGFWPDEGDWFNLFERIKRHQLYYQGHLSTKPDVRPWSLHRNGYPGIAQWGGWVWSGDTESSWKSLEAQVAVGINYSLSIAPFWGSDIGGFYPNEELTGELYLRWHQFASFCASFRSHGRAWWTRLPWGWGLSEMGPLEGNRYPLKSELNNPSIEPIAKKYNELRYQLMNYNYTLAWEARYSGMPLMRAMWLHYPEDVYARGMGSQYLWGRDLLIAPVFKKGATKWNIYLPVGDWYDWWTNEKKTGGQSISREIDLATMPVYVRAGAIIPFDPIRQYSGELVKEPTTLKIYSGANGQYTLYEDDGISQDYLKGKGTWTHMIWNDKMKKLSIEPGAPEGLTNTTTQRVFKIEVIPEGLTKEVRYVGKYLEAIF
jgi:alpha-glucosidase (family GH31 glycosyl hydrolase)